MLKWNEKKARWEDVEFDNSVPPDDRNRAAIFRRQMDSDNDGRILSEEVEIHLHELNLSLYGCYSASTVFTTENDRFMFRCGNSAYAGRIEGLN